ncbi:MULTISPECIES: hypothetical protein [Gammaproteobacteria]|uniref:hypothetical protein n=1 Tax=Gammaproteobacteria TaxID=1236 RepID=UPI00356A3C22
MSDVDKDIEFDAESGIKTEYTFDGRHLDIKATQDAQPILDNIAEMKAMSFNPKAVGRVAGQIPMVLYETWNKEFKKLHGINMIQADGPTRQRFLAAKLNSNEYKKLRVWEGRL